MKKLDLGCAKNKSNGYIGIDISKNSDADIVHDCEKGLPFDDNSIDEVRAYDFLEHIHREKVIFVMNEIWRVLKPNGKLKFKVPDAEKGQGAFQDITHKSWWVQNSFKYYEVREYEELYGIKAHFKIGKLESVKYEMDYWGENYCLMGYLIAIKKNDNINYQCYTTDDLCSSNLQYFQYWLKIKEKKPDLKLTAFTIANYQGKEDLSQSKEFKEFYEKNKDWVEIGVHGLNHLRPQLGWRPKEQQKQDIEKALKILKSFLPDKPLIRFPGFRILSFSESIVRELGFRGIAYQGFIKIFETGEIIKTFDTHCVEKGLENSIGEIWEDLSREQIHQNI